MVLGHVQKKFDNYDKLEITKVKKMKYDVKQDINSIKKAVERIEKIYNQRDVLINMRYEKPVRSSVIHVGTLCKISLQVYKGIPWKDAIDDVLNETYKGIGKGTLSAYRNDYRLFFRKMINTINKEV